MSETKTPLLAEILERDSGIAPGYRHYPKRVTPGAPLEIGGARGQALLKRYALHAEDRPVPEDVARLAWAHLGVVPLEASGLGFAILHRCGEEFYFLIACTWRSSNELWETVFYKRDDAMPGFALFPRDGEHKPALCVWELVPVWHEQGAWRRFLESARDEAAAEAWLADLYAGPA